jgi:serine/threonine protein phosphatase PrpC
VKNSPINRVRFKLADPTTQLVETIDIGCHKFRCSACVLPGQDPQEKTQKVCQDRINLLQKPDYLFASLFDGHGPNGEEVVKFCDNFTSRAFQSESLTPTKISEFLEDLFLQCDDDLIEKSTKINTFDSGTTAIILIVSNLGLHIGSVGDSRAVLATLPRQSAPVGKFKSRKSFQTDFVPSRSIDCLQLTIDQKPNLEEEMTRILKSGGVVAKALNSKGQPHGQYRVFQAGKNIPGLPMSRSLGDVAGKQVGVLPDPIIDHFPILSFWDQFIVIASDGVWDVMSNEEVAAFLETFRKRCLNYVTDPFEETIFTNHCTPARLLAEEARLRWMNLCCEERATVDDISVIVLEITSNELGEDCSASYLATTTRSSSKTLGSVVEVHSDMISFKAGDFRSTVTNFEHI